MRARKFLLATVLAAVTASPLAAAQLALAVVRPDVGQWQVFGQLSNNTDNDGLSSLIINVWATGGNLSIASSSCQLPYGTHYWLDGNVQSQQVGFTEFRLDGTGGIGIRAGQKTTSLGQVVLTDVGYSAGSTPGDETGQGLGPTLISWSAPVLIASGAYNGMYGTLSVAVGDGQVNVLDQGRDPSSPGGVHQIQSVLGGQFRVLVPGDANGDNKVDGGDLALLGAAWLKPGGTWTWAAGDFNGDGNVDGGDLSLMGSYWMWSAPGPPPEPLGALIPEPAAAALIGLSAAIVPLRRRRRS